MVKETSFDLRDALQNQEGKQKQKLDWAEEGIVVTDITTDLFYVATKIYCNMH